MRASEARTWIALLGALVGVVLWQGQWLEDLLGRGPGLAATLVPLALLAAGLARAEWHDGALRELIDRCCSDPRRAFALTALLLAGAVKVYAVPGYRVLEGDGVSHATATYLVAQGLRAGELVGWSNAWALGFPFLQFYPPAFAVAAGALTLLVDDPLVAARIVLALAHALSGVGAFLLARRLTTRPGAAIACAVAYAMSPWHLFQVFHWNRFPASLTWALLPFVLWLWERGLAGRRWRAAMAVLLAGAALAHHGYALFVAIFLVLWAAARLAGRPGERRSRMLELVAVGAAAFGLSAPFVAGYVLESGLTFRPPGLEGARFAFDQPTLASVLVPARRPVGHSGYIGISLFVLGLGGLLLGLLRGGPGRRAAFVGFAYAWVLALGSSLFLYDWLPFARALFYGGRYLIFLVLFLALGVAFAWEAIEDRMRAGEGGRWPLVALGLLGVLLLDLGGTTFTRYRHPFPGGADREAAYRALGDPLRPRLDRRVLELPADPRGFLHTALLPLASGRGTPAPGLWGTLPSVMYTFRGWVDVTRAYEARGRLGTPELERLALLGLDEVLAPAGWSAADASPAALPHPGNRVRIELGRRGFVLAAREWVPMSPDLELPTTGWQLAPFDNDSDPPGAVERLLDRMDIDLERGTARRFVLRHPSRFESRLAKLHDPPSLAAAAAEGPALAVDALDVTPSTVRLSVRVDEACLLRIAQSHYRHQVALLDGERVPSWPDAAHATVLAVPAGAHRIELAARPSPLRRALLVIGWSGALGLALLPGWLRRRRRAAA